MNVARLPFLSACLLLACAALPDGARAADAELSGGTCNSAGFFAALDSVQSSGGGTITFDCASPLTVTFDVRRQISTNVAIVADGDVTFTANPGQALFQVFSTPTLRLQGIRIRDVTSSTQFAIENIGTLQLVDVEMGPNASARSMIGSYRTLQIEGGLYQQNTFAGAGADPRGAVLWVDGGVATIDGAEMSNNGIATGISSGGAIHVAAGVVTLRNARLNGNRALDGGAVFVDESGELRVIDSVFTSNAAGYGAAIEVHGPSQISGSQFAVNVAENDGGAIWVFQGGELQVRTSTFFTNMAGTLGGAIAILDSTGTADIAYSLFLDNISEGPGGAIHSRGALDVRHSTFAGNRAGDGDGGGAILQTGNSVDAAATLAFLTVIENQATFGAGIANVGDGPVGSTMSVANSIIAANVAGPTDSGNCAGDGNLTSLGGNLSDDTYCGGIFGVDDMLNATLPFGPLADNGGPTQTRLPAANSDAIDAVPLAACAGLVDQRGAPRDLGMFCDAGAVERGATPGPFDRVFGDGFESTPL